MIRATIRLLRSTSVRLALLYAVIFIVSSCALAGVMWWRTAGYLESQVDAVIVADTNAVGDRLHDFGLIGAIQTVNERVRNSPDQHTIYLLTDPALTPVAGNLDAWPQQVERERGWHDVPLVHNGQLHATRMLYVPLPGGFQLLVGRDIEEQLAIRLAMLQGLGWSALAAVLIAILGGLALRRAVLGRIAGLTSTATAVMHGDLSGRLPMRNGDDEFDQLARTINAMLQQIEILVDGVRNASHAVAHDLRTPLAELRARLEALLRAPHDDAVRSELEAATGDLDRVIGIFNALLRLAEIDSGSRLAGFRRVAMDKVAEEVADLYGPLAEDRGVSFVVEAPAGFDAPSLEVYGDPLLLAQAIGNLVDNALKFVPGAGHVVLALRPAPGGGVAVAVADDGPGIPDAEKAHVADRFYRGTTSAGTQGVGLGLSLVAAVARLHGGTVALADGNPGLVVTLTLPAPALEPVPKRPALAVKAAALPVRTGLRPAP